MKTGSISVAHPAGYGPACVTARHSFGWPLPMIIGRGADRRICNRLGCQAEQVFVDTRRNRRGGLYQDAYDWPDGWEKTPWGRAGLKRQRQRLAAKQRAADELEQARRWIAEH